jgi:hypothetical protein
MQQRIRDEIKARLPGQPDGRILLTARAWAVKGNWGQIPISRAA